MKMYFLHFQRVSVLLFPKWTNLWPGPGDDTESMDLDPLGSLFPKIGWGEAMSLGDVHEKMMNASFELAKCLSTKG